MGFDPGKHCFEAFTGKPAGAPVIATAMIAVDKYSPVRQGVTDIVAEREFLEFEAVSPEQRLVGYCAKGDDDFESGHCRQFSLQMAIALANFGCCRLVGGRQATYGIGDAAVAQLHGWVGPMVGPQRYWLAGKAEAVQSGVQKFAGDVAGKGATGPVGTFFAGAEADNEQFCIK